MIFSFNSPLHYWNSIGPEAHLTAHLHPLPSRAIPPTSCPTKPHHTTSHHIYHLTSSHFITSHHISSHQIAWLIWRILIWSALLCITLLYFVVFVVFSPSLSSIPVSFIRFISKTVVSHWNYFNEKVSFHYSLAFSLVLLAIKIHHYLILSFHWCFISKRCTADFVLFYFIYFPF
jgi:hypothetical protein